MSAFPSVHFPAIVPPRRDGCDPFEAFGCIHACDVRQGEDGSLENCFQYDITNKAAQKLVPAGACVPFLPPNKGSSIVSASSEDYVRKGAIKKQLGLNIEQQVEELYRSVPDLAFGPVCDLLSDDDQQKIHVPTSKEHRNLLRKNKSIIDAVSCVGVNRSMLHQLLSEETHGKIERMYHNESYYGGCLSYESFKPKSSATEGSCGLLFYPSGQALDTLNIHVLESESVPCFKPSSSLKYQLPVAGCIRQIDTHRSSSKKDVFAGIRTDYYGYVVRCKTKESLECKLIHDVTSQYRIMSLSLSPHLEGEFLFSNERGQVSLVDQSKRFSSSCTFPASRKYMYTPVYAHFTAHPRLAFAHTKDQAYQLDFRLPSQTEDQKIPLFQLPSSCLPDDQYFCVARQHPNNPFYHCLATQHCLFLMDERFPRHSVLQWPHLLSTPPNYLHISPSISSPSTMTPDDLLLAASYSSREVHCFQSSSLCGQAPSASRGPWKIQDNDAWLDLMSVVPSQGEEIVRERLSHPLIGMCSAKLEEDQQQTITVFQISEVGDIYHQVLKVSDDDEFVESMDQDRLSEPCERKCRDFIEQVIVSSEERKESDISSKKIKTKKIMKEIMKHMENESMGCYVCNPENAKLRKGRVTCFKCGLTADQSSSLSDVFPRGVLTLTDYSKNKADHLSLSLLKSVTKADAERCKLGKRLWNMWHVGEETPDKRGKYQKLIKEKKKKKPMKRLQKSAGTSVTTTSLVDSPERTPSRYSQDGISVSQEDHDAMLSGTTPTVILDRLPLSKVEGAKPSAGKKGGETAYVQNIHVVPPVEKLLMSVEKLPPPLPNQLDTPESPRSLASMDSHPLDIARGHQQQQNRQKKQDVGSKSTEESSGPDMTFVSFVRKPKRALKKKGHTMGF